MSQGRWRLVRARVFAAAHCGQDDGLPSADIDAVAGVDGAREKDAVPRRFRLPLAEFGEIRARGFDQQEGFGASQHVVPAAGRAWGAGR